jgi:hypothetical protein
VYKTVCGDAQKKKITNQETQLLSNKSNLLPQESTRASLSAESGDWIFKNEEKHVSCCALFEERWTR